MAGEEHAAANLTTPLPELEPLAQMAVSAWRIMGNEIQWPALPMVCDMLGVSDPAALVDALATIRDYFRDKDRDRL